LDGLSSLVRLTGVNVPSRARFVGEALVQSTLTSLTLGLSFGMVGAMVLTTGPLVPFLVGSWTGYTFGLVNHWRTSSQSAMLYARQYPTILAHSLATERGIVVPPEVVEASEERLGTRKEYDNNDEERAVSTTVSSGIRRDIITLEEWIRQGGLGRFTWSILAAQSCRGDVEELQRQQRQRLMEDYRERHG
jgi:hypothetical protein